MTYQRKDLGTIFPEFRDPNFGAPDMAFWKVQALVRPLVPIVAAADDTLGVLAYAPHKMEILGVYLVDVDANRAQSDTEYRTFTLINKGVAAGETTTIATRHTKVALGAAITAHVPLALTLSATPAALVVERGEVLEFTSAHTGTTGLAQGEGSLVVLFKAIAE